MLREPPMWTLIGRSIRSVRLYRMLMLGNRLLLLDTFDFIFKVHRFSFPRLRHLDVGTALVVKFTKNALRSSLINNATAFSFSAGVTGSGFWKVLLNRGAGTIFVDDEGLRVV